MTTFTSHMATNFGDIKLECSVSVCHMPLGMANTLDILFNVLVNYKKVDKTDNLLEYTKEIIESKCFNIYKLNVTEI